MAKEARLYAKLTLDFADSHKIAPLSDAAFRAYVRMLLWSRRMLTDGKVPGPMARYFAKPKALAELTSNDPVTPSLIRVDDDYFIHDFGEHQMTKAEVEAKQETNRKNGAAGGRAKANRGASKSVSDSVSDGEANSYTESESESETHLTDMTYVPESSHVSNRASERTDLSEEIISEARRAGVEDLAAVLSLFEPIVGRLNPRHGIELAQVILRRSPAPVVRSTAYIAKACRQPDEIRGIAVDVLDLGAVA